MQGAWSVPPFSVCPSTQAFPPSRARSRRRSPSQPVEARRSPFAAPATTTPKRCRRPPRVLVRLLPADAQSVHGLRASGGGEAKRGWLVVESSTANRSPPPPAAAAPSPLLRIDDVCQHRSQEQQRLVHHSHCPYDPQRLLLNAGWPAEPPRSLQVSVGSRCVHRPEG